MTKAVKVGNLIIGGGAPVSIQSMCNTRTDDARATVEQILKLERAGCQLARVAVNTQKAAEALAEIKQYTHIPIAADIHFDYKLAVAAAENGADKIRINPGNIGSEGKVRYLADFLNERQIPIRIGVNEGSLEDEFKSLSDRSEALVKSALKNVSILEKSHFYNTIVSVKSSNVKNTLLSNKKLHALCDYPLHIGVTEAGTYRRGVIKSAAAIGALLAEGIGDTVRVSLAAPPEEEIIAAKILLQSLGLREGAEIIACPTCARTVIDVEGIASELEKLTVSVDENLKIAVMGCVVNGLGEAGDAQFGVAGGSTKSSIFEKGKIVKTVDNSKVLDELKLLLDKYLNR